MTTKSSLTIGLIASLFGVSSQAADWSDTFIGVSSGSKFAEPFNAKDISKTIVNFTHVSGYKHGSNFLSIDYLMSSKDDPAYAGSKDGAREVYAIYRHTLDLGTASGTSLKFGPVKTVGLTAGFDVNTKTDAGYNSKKQMLVFGPTLKFDVPGYLDISLLQLWESNAPYSTYTGSGVSRYSYDPHPMVSSVWGTPVAGFWFKGVANFIASKGKNEFGGSTKPETFIDMALMHDLSAQMGAPKNTFQVGVGYNWWKNKFGNDANGPAGKGAFAKTPTLRTEYHF